MKYELLISACLCGVACRYDGLASPVPELASLHEEGRALALCPEVLGGLSVLRVPCERQGERVFNKDGLDLTEHFLAGAQKTLELMRQHGLRLAVLKQKSPSCGNSFIYDGTFSGRIIAGQGVTAQILRQNGITVLSEDEFI